MTAAPLTAAELADAAKRLDNDVNGNPRYYLAKYLFPVMSQRTRLDAGLNLYRGKRYGAGYVMQSYSLESDLAHALRVIAGEI